MAQPLTIHKLKTWPEYFEATAKGEKTFEYRQDDREFKRGDYLELIEFDPQKGFTGRSLVAIVDYILSDCPGLPAGFVVLGIRVNQRVYRTEDVS